MRGLGVIPEEKPSTHIDGFSRQSVLAHREKRVFGAGSCDRSGRPRTSQNVPGRPRASQSVPEPSRMAQSVPERPRASQPPENVPERARAFHSVRELPKAVQFTILELWPAPDVPAPPLPLPATNRQPEPPRKNETTPQNKTRQQNGSTWNSSSRPLPSLSSPEGSLPSAAGRGVSRCGCHRECCSSLLASQPPQ